MSDPVANPENNSPAYGQLQSPGDWLDPVTGMIPVDTGNRLVDGALPLLTLINGIQRLEPPESISAFYHNIQQQLQNYESEVQHPDNRQALLILAATLDELIMATSWGTGFWLQETLCSRLFNRRDAGRYVFEIIDESLKEADQHMDLLFLSFLCFKSGFSGHFNEGRQEELNSLLVKLYHLFIKQGLLQKIKLETNNNQQEFQPLRSFPYRRTLLCFLGALMFLFIIGGILIYEQKDIAIITLEDTGNVTNQPTDGYQLTTTDKVYELLFNKNN
ncbi:type IVB secretion system protein IcmH/DotU [Thalassotalea sp. G20_0]|uniref:type IVB secretion system protein IcmH/DotU n=1 Tax=Thalassotalea sp. G20_0 TaxID=2821093 RepID=UPI001ADA738C|nr:type IVB secretion system protein IcmH/DotU [Thalassotalea sp. G20_0]MBO9494530.1 type IVB secretion system protein IcmH/DotU [Thalassotalea sp. G20_0]